MAYLSFAEVLDEVGGAKRYHEDVETGRAETEESHPFFDQKAADSDSEINAELRRGGFLIPLATPLTDGKMRNIALGIYLGRLTQTNSNRQQWMIELEKAAKADLKAIGDGGAIVIGAEVDESETAGGDIFGSDTENPIFDFGDPYSSANDVFASLGPGPRRWR